MKIVQNLFKQPRQLATLAIGCLYLAVVITTFMNHELCRDELQAWLRAQVLPHWQDWFVIPGEGHPPVWYWLIKIASVFFTLEQTRYVYLLCAVAVAVLVAAMAWEKPVLVLAILFTDVLLFWWVIPFRSYGVGGVAILSAVWFFRQEKWNWCALCLITACWTHLYCFCLLPLFVGEEFLRTRTFKLAKIMAIPCLLGLVLIVLSGQHAPGATLKEGGVTSFLFYSIITFGLPVNWMSEGYLESNGNFVYFFYLEMVLPFLAMFFIFGRNLYTAIVLLILITFNLLFTLLYAPHGAHGGFVIFTIIVAALLRPHTIHYPVLIAVLFLSDLGGLAMAHEDIMGKFSDAPAVYEYLRKSDLKVLVLDESILTVSGYRYNLEYNSLPTAHKAKGLVEWNDSHATMDQYRKGYAAAGSPDQFLLVEEAHWSPDWMYRRIPLDKICRELQWNCQLKLRINDTYMEDVNIYKITSNKTMP